jgi:hypothetical protein
MNLTLATWFHADEAGSEGRYAQVPGSSSARRFQNVYLRCLVVCMASARRHAPDARLVIVSNAEIDTFDGRVGRMLRRLVDELHVEWAVVPYSFNPGLDWSPAWRNQFYVFDALEYLTADSAPDQATVLIDSDIVIWQSLESLTRDCITDGFVSYLAGYGREDRINGLTRSDLARSAIRLFGGDQDDSLPYLGGEFLAGSNKVLSAMIDDARGVWEKVRAAQADGDPLALEEAHLVSVLAAQRGLRIGNGNQHVRRMWNGTFSPSTVTSDDLQLTMWHLPSEKRFGFRRLYKDIARVGPAEWTRLPDVTWRRSVAARLGVPRRHLSKRILDFCYAAPPAAVRRVRRRS